MKVWTHLFLASLLASLLMACSDDSADDSGNVVQPEDGCYIHLFDGDDFDSDDDNDVIAGPGEFSTLENLPGATNDDWDDDMDSFKVGSAATVQVWEDENFEGDTQTYQPGTEQSDADEFSSMTISCS